MPQLQITATTLSRMKKIVGTTKVHDGDYLVNEMIDVFEKKISSHWFALAWRGFLGILLTTYP